MKLHRNKIMFQITAASLMFAAGLLLSPIYGECSALKAAEVSNDGDIDTAASVNSDDKSDNGTDMPLEDKPFLTIDDVEKAEASFTKDSYKVIVNNHVLVGLKCNIPDKFLRVTYTSEDYYTYFDSYGGGMVTTVAGCYAGTSKIKATVLIDYYDEDGMYVGCKSITVTSTVDVLGYSDRELTVGEQFLLNYRQYDEYASMKYEVADTSIATVTEGGIVTAISAGQTSVYITDEVGGRIYVGTITVKSNYVSMSESRISRAVGSVPYQLSVVNITGGTIEWSSKNNQIASVDSMGMVTPHTVGETEIMAIHTSETGFKTTCSCFIAVTNPVLSIAESNVAKNNSITLTVNGTTGKAEWSSTNVKVASVYSDNDSYDYYDYNDDETDNYNAGEKAVQPQARVYGNRTGKCIINAVVDGVTLTCDICVTNPTLKKSFFVVTKGKRQTLKITGINSKSVVKYTSANPKIASVNSKGIVKAKRIGFAPIKIEVDGAVCVASINIGTKKGVRAVLNALKVEGAKYSQTRRMSKGYYDCSSLVWRSYSPLGVTFGDRHYAPVAANEARYCVSHKKSLPRKYLNKLNKLRPGDLFFFRGSYNGRYKNIYHVAIYMGQEGYGSYTAGKIIHASDVAVSTGYIYNQDNIVVIGRP